MDAETQCCHQNVFQIPADVGGSGFVSVTCDIKLALVDGKVVGLLMGCGGAYCKLCITSDKAAHIVSNVVSGFSLNRRISDLEQIYDFLFDQNKAKILKKKGDYATRQGLTKKNLTSQESVCTAARVLHLRLCDLNWFEHFVYCIIASVLIWKGGVLSAAQHKALDMAKKKFIAHIKDRTGILLDSPTAGGSTDTGNVAWRFFSPEVHDAIIEIIPEDWKDRVSVVHGNLSLILRVMSSTGKVDEPRFQELCTETYVFILEECEFAHISESMHGTLGHSHQLIQLNDGYGLGNLTEQGSEGQLFP